MLHVCVFEISGIMSQNVDFLIILKGNFIYCLSL